MHFAPVWALILALLGGGPALARDQPDRLPAIAVIIDDIGDRRTESRRAATLPGPVACALLPYSPYSTRTAVTCHRSGKEVLLHLPMQANSGLLRNPGALTEDMTREQFTKHVRDALSAVPHVSGVNNHMGSLLTRNVVYMGWLMEALSEHYDGLFFVDSRTTPYTVAERAANEAGVAVLRRHIFLDNVPDPAVIEDNFDRLLRLARRQGHAVAIAHPYPATLNVLERRLLRLREEEVELISLERMIERLRQQRAQRNTRHYIDG